VVDRAQLHTGFYYPAFMVTILIGLIVYVQVVQSMSVKYSWVDVATVAVLTALAGVVLFTHGRLDRGDEK